MTDPKLTAWENLRNEPDEDEVCDICKEGEDHCYCEQEAEADHYA